MSKFKGLKQKVRDNKGKIIAGIIFIRYAEGRLNNALKNDNVISEVDERLRREEIDFFSKQIEKIDKAESMISK